MIPHKYFILVLIPLILGACSKSGPAELIPGDYETWNQSVDRVLNQPIPGHGDGLRKIFYNSLAGEYSLDQNTQTITFPEGSIFVKEIYGSPNPMPGENPVMLTAMVKDSASPYQRGSWVWIMKHLENGVETILNEEFCFTCHNGANEPFPFVPGNVQGRFQDFIFYIPNEEENGSGYTEPGYTSPY